MKPISNNDTDPEYFWMSLLSISVLVCAVRFVMWLATQL